ncbi:MAG: glycosyltransferase family 39 protein [Chthoniobacteraceae bacterium]
MNSHQRPKDDVLPGFAVLVLASIIVLFAVRNLPWHLDDLDQAKQAFVSYQMIEDGKWLVQELPDSAVSDRPRPATKPPLQGWLSALAYLVAGGHGWEVAWRLPAFVAALLILRGLWRAGDELYGNNVGAMLAAGAFGLNSYVPRLASLVRTDMLLTAFIFFTGLIIVRKLRSGEPWTFRERAATCLLLLGSTLTKGPIAYGFLLPGIVAFLLVTRKWEINRRVWAGWIAWLLPAAIFGAWIWHGCVNVPGFYDQVVVKEFFGRFTVGERAVHHTGWPGTYSLGLLGRTLPWTLLLIAMFTVKQVRVACRSDAALTWLLCWTLGGLVFMECVPSKRFDRILPVVPPMCLLLAAAARHLPKFELRGQPIGRIAILAPLLAVPLAAGYAGLRMFGSFDNDARALVAFGAATRAAVQEKRDRLVVVSGKDEGMLLYAGAQRFTRMDDAIAAWRFKRIDWLVLSEGDFDKHRAALEPFDLLASTPLLPEKFNSYRLLHRVEVKATPPAAPVQLNTEDGAPRRAPSELSKEPGK